MIEIQTMYTMYYLHVLEGTLRDGSILVVREPREGDTNQHRDGRDGPITTGLDTFRAVAAEAWHPGLGDILVERRVRFTLEDGDYFVTSWAGQSAYTRLPWAGGTRGNAGTTPLVPVRPVDDDPRVRALDAVFPRI